MDVTFTIPSLSPCILERVNARPASSRYSKMHLLPAAGLLAGTGLLAGMCVIAGCTSPATATPSVTPAATGSRADLRATAKAHAAATAPAPPPHVTMSRIRTADGSLVTVATFGGSVRYALHNGSQDPGPAYARLVRAGPVVAGAERRHLLAAFNGGFLLRSRAGGYEQEGHVFRALRYGLASLVIDRSGRARIGVWHVSVPARGEAVYSVRQNLWPLVLNGRPTPQASRWWRWGGTIGHAEYVARSALGQDASGDLLYAASMSTVPQDLAEALARSGARIAMELNINPEWVQLAVARTPAHRGHPRPGPPGQPVPHRLDPGFHHRPGPAPTGLMAG